MRISEIKLTSRRPANIDAFIDDFFECTTSHPFNRRARLWGPISIELSPFGSEIHLSDIVSLQNQNTGNGTKALEFLKSLADEHGVVISGIAEVYSDNPEHIQDTGRLKEWYRKNGFSVNGDESSIPPKKECMYNAH